MGSEMSGKSLSPVESLQQPGYYPHFTHKEIKAQRDSEAAETKGLQWLVVIA